MSMILYPLYWRIAMDTLVSWLTTGIWLKPTKQSEKEG